MSFVLLFGTEFIIAESTGEVLLVIAVAVVAAVVVLHGSHASTSGSPNVHE